MCILQDFKRLFFFFFYHTCMPSICADLHLCVFTLHIKWCTGNKLPAQVLIIPITLTYMELHFFFFFFFSLLQGDFLLQELGDDEQFIAIVSKAAQQHFGFINACIQNNLSQIYIFHFC